MSSASVLALLVGAVGFLVLLDWFVHLERRGDRHTIFCVFMVVVLVEAILAGTSSRVPVGLFRPVIAGQDFRLPDLVLLAVITARPLGRPMGRVHIPTGMLPLLAFGLWTCASVVIGLLNGFPGDEVLFQGKVAFYLLGALTAAAGADLIRLADQLRRPAAVLAVVTAIAVVMAALGLTFDVRTPVQDFVKLGNLSNDSVTLLTVLGCAVLLIEAMRAEVRRSVVISGLVLLVSPLAAHQRAAYLVMAGLVVGLAVSAAGSTWRRRSRVTLVEIALGVAGLILVVSFGVSVTASPAVVVDRVDAAFGGAGEAASAQERVDLADQAIDLIRERPVIGWGAGVRVTRVVQRTGELVETPAHNLLLDLTMRSGIVGLGLFAMVVGTALHQGLRRWRAERSNEAAAVALASTLGVIGVLLKAQVEPALEKYRLSILLGVCLGLVLVAGRTTSGSGNAGADPCEQPPTSQGSVVPSGSGRPGLQP